jgi:1-deoxy-D-xylulose-5-phosphate reductoisomerase
MKSICLLGATGSIGQSTLDIIDQHPDRFRITALSAHQQVDQLIALCIRYQPLFACIVDETHFQALQVGLKNAGLSTEALAGHAALNQMAADASSDTVVAAIVGAAGVSSTLSAVNAGKRILLANKESVVLAGQILMEAVQASGAELFPIDSEHNAIYQCLPEATDRNSVRRLILTASGGPFLGKTREMLGEVTPEQACKHPKWTMGRKISVDSATLMNKGLEVIEAHHLFNTPAKQIEVVVHPQSIVHSMVEYIDGSVLAQMGQPDMRTAIAYGLSYPDRIDCKVPTLDLCQIGQLQFQQPDIETFTCLKLAYQAIEAAGNAPTILNAANEVAVAAFLEGKLPFLAIANIIESTLNDITWEPANELAVLMANDALARQHAFNLISKSTPL